MKNNIFNKTIIWSLILGLTMEATPVWALTKDETIYAKLNNNGSVNNVIISEHINDNGSNILIDKTMLKDIKNVNGNEKYEQKDNQITWEANGNDIYYQGTTEKELPIKTNISYYLDGKETDVNEMIGKAGKVKIVIKYNNTLENKVLINGKAEILFTPFVVSTLTLINDKDNSNITVTNGKVIDNGINKMIIALAAPGLYDSLELDKLKGLDEVIISYDTKKFETSSIYAVATSKLLEDSDLDIFNDANKLYDQINLLSESGNKLVNGSNELVDGASKLTEGEEKIINGLDSAYEGSSYINKSVKTAMDTLKEQSNTGLDEETLEAIATQTVSKAALNNEQLDMIGKQAILTVHESNEYKQMKAQYDEMTTNVETLKVYYAQVVETGDEAAISQLSSKLESAITAQTTYKTIMDVMEQTAYKTAMATASQVSSSVANTVSKEVAQNVSNAVKTEMGSQVISSLSTLSSGLEQLNQGLLTLKDGMTSLYDGTKQLDDGLKTLSNGLTTFNDTGVQKIATYVNKDVKNIQAKTEKLLELSNDYKTFDEIDKNSNGSSKIILVIDGVKLEKKKETSEAVVEENKGLIEKIKGLFRK